MWEPTSAWLAVFMRLVLIGYIVPTRGSRARGSDPIVFAGTAALLLGVTLVAVPTVRASRVSPTEAIRCE